MKILLAVDGSEYTARMLDYLGAHKEWSSAGHAFTVFHAVLPVPHRAAAFAHKVGHPADEIASFAEHGKFDLVIMGSRGQGALTNLVLGSVAMKVLARCAVPVLLVR